MDKTKKIGRTRDTLKKWKPYKLSPRMKRILPVVVMLQDFEKHPPEAVIDRVILFSSPNAHNALTDIQKQKLKSYLGKYGYEQAWIG